MFNMNPFMNLHFQDRWQNIPNLKVLEEELQVRFRKKLIIKNQFLNLVLSRKDKSHNQSLEGIMIGVTFLFESIIKIHFQN